MQNRNLRPGGFILTVAMGRNIVAEGERPEEQRKAAPPGLAETSSQPCQGSDPGFALPAILEIQRTLEKLEQSINDLTDRSKEYGDILDSISTKVSVAQAIITAGLLILGVAGGFATYTILTRIWDAMSPLLPLKPLL